tara:strand:+ start:948 stop:1145 length:198 start_codon:yes stop_codon:yes gene_type:complete
MVLWTACLVYTHVKLINNAIKQFEEQNRVLVKELEKQRKTKPFNMHNTTIAASDGKEFYYRGDSS